MRIIRPLIICFFCITAASTQAENITIHVSDWPPHLSSTPNTTSPLVEYTRNILHQRGYTDINIIYTNWQRAYYQVENGHSVMSLAWAKTHERLQKFIFSEKPVLVDDIFVYFNPDKHKPDPQNPFGYFSGQTIAYPRKYSEIEHIVENGSKLIMTNTYESVVHIIHTGRATATLATPADDSIIQKTIQKIQKTDKTFTLKRIKVSERPYYAIFSRALPYAHKIAEDFNAGHAQAKPYMILE